MGLLIPLDRDPQAETPVSREPSPEGTCDQRQRPPRRKMGPGSQTGSDIIQRLPTVDRQTPVKTLPCQKLRLWAVIISSTISDNKQIYMARLRRYLTTTNISTPNVISTRWQFTLICVDTCLVGFLLSRLQSAY